MNCGEVLALVPARGGSKSIPRKNVREIAGKPMVAHSIAHALSSKHITRTILTTDDDEIAEIGERYGAEVPFRRPAEISADLSTDYEFVRHALEWLRDHEGYSPDLVVQLRPTTPMRDQRLIDAAIEALAGAPEADSLRAVVKCSFTPYKMWTLGTDGYLRQLLQLEGYPEPYNQPRQLLPEVVQQDGFIDIVRPRTIFEQNSITGMRVLPFHLDRWSIDIDDEHELEDAEIEMRAKGK
jgi:CMP-N,N'-diacetyllegionaminic acid synthase